MFQLNIFELVNIRIVFFMVSPSPKLIKRLCSASSIRLVILKNSVNNTLESMHNRP